jgi:hypothetical protein
MLESLVSSFFSPRGAEEDEIRMKELVKFFVLVKLLIQQYAAPSATREEIDQNQLAFLFRFGNGIIQAALEPVLSEAEGG